MKWAIKKKSERKEFHQKLHEIIDNYPADLYQQTMDIEEYVFWKFDEW